MAKFFKGILGPISGKVGNLIFSSINGVNYVKRAPTRLRTVASAKQLMQREKLGLAMRFLSPVRNLLNDSYRTVNPKASGFHTALKQVLTGAITGEYPDLKIDYSKVSLIRGHLNRPRIEMSYLEKLGELHLSWKYVPATNAYLNDELFALIYCPSLTQKWHEMHTGILRSEQISVIKLPCELLGHEIHIWLAYRSEMMDAFSKSVYMGQVFAQEPDGYEK